MQRCKFQIFLDELSIYKPNVFNVLTIDGGAFHKARELKIPKNIALILLPPYSPKLNPTENMRQNYKAKFTNKLYKTLDEVSEFITNNTKKITEDVVKCTCSFSYIFEFIKWAD